MTLEAKRKQYSIPPIYGLPVGKRCIVWRLPPEERTAGGLIIPGTHETQKSRGILLAAGLKARDILKDALVEIGDEVYFGRFAGMERELARAAESTTPTLLELMVEDIGVTVEGLARLEREFSIEYDEEVGEHHYQKKATKRRAA